MELLTLKDKDFVYEILNDDMGEVTGCLWMTSTTRMNFELYGGYLSVDAMKRDINTLLWPYMATSMWNDLNEVCVGCEGILLSERRGISCLVGFPGTQICSLQNIFSNSFCVILSYCKIMYFLLDGSTKNRTKYMFTFLPYF